MVAIKSSDLFNGGGKTKSVEWWRMRKYHEKNSSGPLS